MKVLPVAGMVTLWSDSSSRAAAGAVTAITVTARTDNCLAKGRRGSEGWDRDCHAEACSRSIRVGDDL